MAYSNVPSFIGGLMKRIDLDPGLLLPHFLLGLALKEHKAISLLPNLSFLGGSIA